MARRLYGWLALHWVWHLWFSGLLMPEVISSLTPPRVKVVPATGLSPDSLWLDNRLLTRSPWTRRYRTQIRVLILFKAFTQMRSFPVAGRLALITFRPVLATFKSTG